MNHTLLIIAFLVIIPAANAQRKETPSKQEVLKKVYDKSYKTPTGFYQDPTLKAKNVSLYYHQPRWFATNEKDARKIVEKFLAKSKRKNSPKITKTRKTKKFFDFKAGRIWYRIHNPRYFVWAGPRVGGKVPFGAQKQTNVTIGKFANRPVTLAAAKEFAEYHWLVRFYNLGGAKVLKSEADKHDGKLTIRLFTTFVVYGDFGVSDMISVLEVTYVVDPNTGVTTRSQRVVAKVQGKRN
ncbi:MAG: hypothetical protein ACFCD0_12125 [Gemmataceae bacterium]